MKTPFRSIRMTLLNENKTAKYLKYAIGEILLIIIGILIAVQISNWNDDRKAQAEFDLYIVQLREDVGTAIKNVKSSKNLMDSFQMEVEYIPVFLELSEYGPEELAAFERGLNSSALLNRPQVHVGLLGELLDGKTDSIRHNPDLAQKALEMEGYVEMKLDNIQNNSQRIELIVGNRLSQFIGLGASGKERPPKYVLEDLKSSKDFINIIYTIETIMVRIMGFDDSITEELESFLTVLEEYE